MSAHSATHTDGAARPFLGSAAGSATGGGRPRTGVPRHRQASQPAALPAPAVDPRVQEFFDLVQNPIGLREWIARLRSWWSPTSIDTVVHAFRLVFNIEDMRHEGFCPVQSFFTTPDSNVRTILELIETTKDVFVGGGVRSWRRLKPNAVSILRKAFVDASVLKHDVTASAMMEVIRRQGETASAGQNEALRAMGNLTAKVDRLSSTIGDLQDTVGNIKHTQDRHSQAFELVFRRFQQSCGVASSASALPDHPGRPALVGAPVAEDPAVLRDQAEALFDQAAQAIGDGNDLLSDQLASQGEALIGRAKELEEAARRARARAAAASESLMRRRAAAGSRVGSIRASSTSSQHLAPPDDVASADPSDRSVPAWGAGVAAATASSPSHGHQLGVFSPHPSEEFGFVEGAGGKYFAHKTAFRGDKLPAKGSTVEFVGEPGRKDKHGKPTLAVQKVLKVTAPVRAPSPAPSRHSAASAAPARVVDLTAVANIGNRLLAAAGGRKDDKVAKLTVKLAKIAPGHEVTLKAAEFASAYAADRDGDDADGLYGELATLVRKAKREAMAASSSGSDGGSVADSDASSVAARASAAAKPKGKGKPKPKPKASAKSTASAKGKGKPP